MISYLWPLAVGGCQRPYSIRTRIKTASILLRRSSIDVRDHIPLEQGLRLYSFFIFVFLVNVRDHIPLEQGLRRFVKLPFTGVSCSVRDHIPLEQGLRRSCLWDSVIHGEVRDHIPLEQGLRLPRYYLP